MPKISVLLLTYNREHFLPKIIDCLKKQTYQDYEVILVNNGSTDGTAKICDEYALLDCRVKLVVMPENKGKAPGFNAGLAVAAGEYITCVDDDDRCKPKMLAFLVSLAEDTGADIAMCGSYYDFDGRLEPYFVGDEKFVFERLQGLRELLKRQLYNVAPPTKLVRRTLWDGIWVPINTIIDDIHVTYKLFERARRVAVHNTPLYYFRKHEANMTSFIENPKMLTPELLSEYINMYQTRANYLLEKAPEIAEEIEQSIIAFMQSMCKIITTNELLGLEEHFNFMTKFLNDKGDGCYGV
ncbi:MAG: glycosyltransferase [Defluviitaleaceae bacterium]|nr:glycosyltransferase [Defluviitaleaceae bacterium]